MVKTAGLANISLSLYAVKALDLNGENSYADMGRCGSHAVKALDLNGENSNGLLFYP